MVDQGLEDAAARIRRVASDHGLKLKSSETVRPNLEDVFVAATQERKALRDGEV
jgi:hypothetical protein